MQFYKIDGHIQDKSKNDNAQNSKEQKELKGDIQSKSMSFNQGLGYKAYFTSRTIVCMRVLP